ncbi:hypothetical protein B0O99DRAFT_145228 [Bisporella sp. PMI_857]|nr:hypothetical protein B0O99DRAFT_145228 [Bisporella sp. PMI_857]
MWTMERRVAKVRPLPVGTVPVRSRGDFRVVRSNGRIETDWEGWARYALRFYAEKYGAQYIEYGSSPPKPSKQTLVPNIERLLIASAPIQVFIMSVRRVCRWEDQSETLKFLGLYLIFWGCDL